MSVVTKYYYSRPRKIGRYVTSMSNETLDVFREIKAKRYTMAAVYDDENKTINFGLAICQPMDNFCKKTGRDIAFKNALAKPFHTITNFSGRRNDYADEVLQIMQAKEQELCNLEFPRIIKYLKNEVFYF